MKIYLDGIEYKAYREIMKSLGVKYGCLNYTYIWSRTPRFNLEESASFFQEILVTPGSLPSSQIDFYIEYLNTNSNIITAAIELYTKDRIMLDIDCDVEIIPWYTNLILAPRVAVSTASLNTPFIMNKLNALKEYGTKIHGINCDFSYFDSMNTGTWMRGTAGFISHFTKKNRMEIYPANQRTTIARQLLKEGYELDLNRIKRGNWKEVSKMNCIGWKKYQEYMEER